MIRLLVKGNVFDACDAATKRGIAVKWTKETTDRHGSETHGEVEDDFHNAVAHWFCEEGKAPFPKGTLLHYSLPDYLK